MSMPPMILWSGLTIGLYFGFRRLFVKTGLPILHPVLWTTLALITAIELTGHPYPAYDAETKWIVNLLGPAVVALAIPVYNRRQLILRNLGPLAVIVTVSVLFSVFSVKLLLAAFPLDPGIVRSLSLKAITAPVALEISRENGGITAITAIGGMFAAIMGAVLGPLVLTLSRVTDPKAIGLALGCGSHGVGTARAVELGETHGAFASIGMSCSAIVSSVLCPLILRHLL